MPPIPDLVVGVLAIPLVILGVRAMFAPAGMQDDLGLDVRGPVGLNTVRGMLGGMLLSSAAMIGFALVTGETVWLLAVALLMTVAAVGRIIGVVADGFEKPVLKPIVVEIVIAAAALFAHCAKTPAAS